MLIKRQSSIPSVLFLTVVSSIMVVLAGCIPPCDDGNFCNGIETLVAGRCQPGTAVDCDDGIFCDGSETCDPVLGCLADPPPSCDDGVVCTEDSCNLQTDSCDNIPQDTATTVFTANFDDETPPEFSGVTTTEGVQGYDGLGTDLNVFGGLFLRNITPVHILSQSPPGSPTTLTLIGLPPHTSIDLNFLLAIIDSWDGVTCTPFPLASPDIFNVRVDGVLIFSKEFANTQCNSQTYVPPTGAELARVVQLGFQPLDHDHSDSAYDMGVDPAFDAIPHDSSTLTIEWFASGSGWQGGDPTDDSLANDESWAIDNVEVILNCID